MKRTAKIRGHRLGPMVQVGLICLLTYVALVAILFTGITPEQYDIKVGMPAPTQIKATKDVQDTVTTEALREAAANAVEPSYKSVDSAVITDVTADLDASFSQLQALRAELASEDVRSLSSARMNEINTSLPFTLTLQQLTTLVETSDQVVENIFADARSEVRSVLSSTLPEGQETAALRSIRSELNTTYSEQLISPVIEAIRACLRPNMLIDEEITEANRQKAREAVQIEWCVKDEVIVRDGEIVTPSQYAMIAQLGILDEDSFDVRLFSGIALMVLVMMLSIGFYLYQFNPSVLDTPKQMLLLCLIVALTIGLSFGFRSFHIYLMPISLALLLVTLLLDGRLALFVNFMLSMLLSMLATTGSGTYSVALMSSISGPIIVCLFAHKTVRTTPLLAGVIISAVNFLITMAVGFINSAELYDVLINAGMAAGNGIVSAVLCIGLQPLLEWMFNLATATKLIELSNPNQPLLRRLLLEASGTYHHSIIVANLAEAACSAIGANGLLARVAAYYHDIGKLKRPMYFKENQMGDNPHDRTDPRVSTAILTAHTRDGAQLAQKARVPEAVVDIIRQHHGDTPVMYFYDKAQKLYGDNVDIAAFRYEGPRPQSREAAVVMLADTIEAATRALPNPDPEKIDALIRKLVRGKLNDGQLDNSSLTFSDLDKISGAFSTVLTGVFHERIEYPEVNIPPRMEQPLAPVQSVEAPAAPANAEQQTEDKPAQQIAENQPAAKPAENAAKPAEQPVEAPAKPAEAPRPAVTVGQPAPPVQNAPAAAKPVEQPRPAVTVGQPAPPVQNAEPVRPIVSPGMPVPPVQNAEPVRPAAQPAAPVQNAAPKANADESSKGASEDGN